MSKKLKPSQDFKPYYDESCWILDEHNSLKEVRCYIDGKEKYLPVTWDDEGAYVLNGGEKVYVLVECR